MAEEWILSRMFAPRLMGGKKFIDKPVIRLFNCY